MDDATIAAVVSEIAPLLIGRAPGKIFQLSHQSLAIDFGLREHGYLFVSVEPAAPRLYLIKRRVRDLEKASVPTSQFAMSMRKELAQKTVTSVEKLPTDRVVTLTFEGSDDLGLPAQRTLIAQLTGRSANLFLLRAEGAITACLKETKGIGQMAGEKYRPPNSDGSTRKKPSIKSLEKSDSESLSERLDQHYTLLEASRGFESQVAAARAQLQKEISRRTKLLKKLERDLSEHSNAEQHKQTGDLLLANVGSAKRAGGRLKLTNYFAEGAPEIEIEMDEKLTIPEEASRRFELYSRSKRARVQIANRIKQVKAELAEFEAKREQIETSPATFTDDSAPAFTKTKSKTRSRETRVPGARRYVSSDGYEILVGRAARDNDNLTFKVAKPNDLWLHAADYPGSHVIVRNPTRKEIPHRTIVEAAQLAAYFSQASKDPKVDVHHTQRKFLSKPKGGAAGLVRMSKFRNVVVQPAEAIERVL
jgi:predicted ribosome quality control (RQC) complex YloA/Tae2 family protein